MSRPLLIQVTGDATTVGDVDVIDAVTGEKLTNVVSIDIHLEPSPANCRVTVTLFGSPDIDIQADADVELQSP